MKTLIAASAITVAAMFHAVPALADNHEEKKPVILETNEKGQATRIMLGDKTYAVCMNETQDSCINPRAAGLKWGNRPLAYWPGKPASQIDQPLPAKKPE